MKETAAEMTMVVHMRNQILDLESRDSYYRNEGFAAIPLLGSAIAYSRSLFPTCQDRVASDFSTLVDERVTGMPSNIGIKPSQQRSSTDREVGRLL